MYLGIDLGTSNSAVVGSVGGELRLFKTAEGTDVLPSAIYIDKRGHKFIGKRAYDRIPLPSSGVARHFKRLMGTATPTVFEGAGVSMTPEECSAEVLRTLVGQASLEAPHESIQGAVITIPAAFNQMQTEATMNAATMAGIDRVDLIQEPVAAAMAAIAGSKSKDGLFLVYDLGGGTFDVALVQSVSGTVTVVAHEGVNQLGGLDFDRALVRSVVLPWLRDNFALPADPFSDPRYRKLMALLLYAAENAKISLSTVTSTSIHAPDEELSTVDENGREIYLSLDVTRAHLEQLIGAKIDKSIELCKKTILQNGYTADDIERVVLVGGPSKMPMVRARVSEALSIPVDTSRDPMTAVAFGAAIYAESRDWSEAESRRKASRGAVVIEGAVSLQLDYLARTERDTVTVRFRNADREGMDGLSVRLDTPEGDTSGLVKLSGETPIDVPLRNLGENHIRATVYDRTGTVVESACRTFSVVRTQASATGSTAAHTLSIKVVSGALQGARNELVPLVEKGAMLPATGVASFRCAKDLVGGEPGTLSVELFEQPEGVREPDVCLAIGAFQVSAMTDLDKGERLSKGDPVKVHWALNDSGLLKCTVELPQLGRILDSRSYYSPNATAVNFDGADGDALAAASIEAAQVDLDTVAEAIGDSAGTEVEELRARLARQQEELQLSHDADSRRQVSAEALAVRQEVSRLRHAPDHRLDVLAAEQESLASSFEDNCREHTTDAIATMFDAASEAAGRSLAARDVAGLERAVERMEEILYRSLWANPGYIVFQFKARANERHLAVDGAVHEELVARGNAALQQNNMDELKHVLFAMFENRFAVGTDRSTKLMADLWRA